MDWSSVAIAFFSLITSLGGALLTYIMVGRKAETKIKVDDTTFLRSQILTKEEWLRDREEDRAEYDRRQSERERLHQAEIKQLNREHEDKIRQITAAHTQEVSNLNIRINDQDDLIKTLQGQVARLKQQNPETDVK